MSVDTLIAPAVSETISQLEAKLQPEDAALARLAQRYAATIDDARQIANALNNVDQTEDNARLLYALWARVEAQTVLDTLGPKLLAALEQLGATPKARASAKGGAGRGGSGGRLAALREAR